MQKTLLAAIAIVISLILVRRLRIRQKLPLPPGPKPLPLVGNIYDVPREASWKVFQQWGDQYGDMIYFHTFGKPVIVINSAQIARDLLDKRSALYSYRPQFAMANEVIGWKFSTTSMDYNTKYKRQRRYLQTYFQKSQLPKFYTLQQQEMHRLLKEVLENPDDYREHIRRMSGAITMMVTYGHEVQTRDDMFIRLAEKGVQTIRAAGVIGAHIVDFIPWLRYLPHRLFIPAGTKEDLQNFIHIPFKQVKGQMAEGTAKSCYTTALLDQTQGNDEEGVMATAALVYSGGLDTTMSGLLSIFTQLAANQDIQAKLHSELDSVIGRDRLPTLNDRDQLPYLDCVISELIRYAASTPIGVPHRLSQDDVYNGYLIPAGSMIMANQWAMLHDPRVYPDPERFNPDRFKLGGEGAPQPDPRGVAFGFGRRICPGKDIAESTIWLFTAVFFYAFRVAPGLDSQGKDSTIDVEYTEGSVRHPKPFKCSITPRRENLAHLIRLSN